MKTSIYSTAIISVISGAALPFPVIATTLMPTEPPNMLVHLFGAMAMFLGIMLVLRA